MSKEQSSDPPLSHQDEPEAKDADSPQAAEASAAKARPAKAKKRSAPKRAEPVEIDERAIRAPDTQTLVMLALVAAVTLIMWASGRAACNLHPPRETKRPREVELADLASTAKDAALELGLRWAKKDYDGALQLANGEVKRRLEQAKKKCEKEGTACTSDKEKLKDSVLGAATVLSRRALETVVRIRIKGADEPKSPYRLVMKRQPRLWKAQAFEPGPGSVPAVHSHPGSAGGALGGAAGKGGAGAAQAPSRAGGPSRPLSPHKLMLPPNKPAAPPARPPAPPAKPPALPAKPVAPAKPPTE